MKIKNQIHISSIRHIVSAIVCCIVFVFISICAFSQAFKVCDTIPIKHGTSKLRLYRNAEKWFEKEKGQKLIAKNWKERKLKGKGYFPYTNYIQIPDIYLSSHAAEKTKGSIIFNIDVEIQDSIIIVNYTNFLHEARFTEYGETSFGRLMDYEKVPSGKCMEVEEWCNAVWKNMKDWAIYETKMRTKRMIPSTLVRKRTFKVEEEKELVAPPKEQFDPYEYLKIDNYLLKDTEGKYADYDKWPEDIAAEKAAAAAALAEKERKKNKDVEEEEWDEYEESSESQATESEMVQQSAVEEAASNDESYDEGYEDYESDDVKPSKDKSKKDKSAKTEKTKKEKKTKKSDDDDWGEDYDDYDDDY